MPNWIANTLKITTEDEKQTAEILAAFKGKRTNGDEADFTFNALFLCPITFIEETSDKKNSKNTERIIGMIGLVITGGQNGICAKPKQKCVKTQ